MALTIPLTAVPFEFKVFVRINARAFVCKTKVEIANLCTTRCSEVPSLSLSLWRHIWEQRGKRQPVQFWLAERVSGQMAKQCVLVAGCSSNTSDNSRVGTNHFLLAMSAIRAMNANGMLEKDDWKLQHHHQH